MIYARGAEPGGPEQAPERDRSLQARGNWDGSLPIRAEVAAAAVGQHIRGAERNVRAEQAGRQGSPPERVGTDRALPDGEALSGAALRDERLTGRPCPEDSPADQAASLRLLSQELRAGLLQVVACLDKFLGYRTRSACPHCGGKLRS